MTRACQALLASIVCLTIASLASSQSDPPERFVAGLAVAERDHWRWHRVEDSEHAAPVRAIEEATDHTIWVGSDEGLAHFDGLKLRWAVNVPRVPVQSIVRLDSGRVAIQVDGQIWVGDRHGFSVLESRPVDDNGRPGSSRALERVKQITSDRHGRLYAQLFPGGPTELVRQASSTPPTRSKVPRGVRAAARPSAVLDPHRFSSAIVVLEDALVDLNGVLPHVPIPRDWVVSAAFPEPSDDAYLVSVLLPPSAIGLWRVSADGQEKIQKAHANSVLAMDANDRGEVLALLQGHQLLLRKADGTWRGPRLAQSPLTGANMIRFLSTGDVVVGGRDGLSLLRRGDATWEQLYVANNGKPHSNILSFHVGSNGDFWAGSSGGLARHRPDAKPVRVWKVAGVSLDAITAIAEDEQGRILVGSGAGRLGGVLRFDPDRPNEGEILRGPDHPGHVHALRRDPNGRIWALTLPDTGPAAPPDAEGPGGSIWIVGDDGPLRMTPPIETVRPARYYDAAFGPGEQVFVASAEGLLEFDGSTWRRVPTFGEDDSNRIYSLALGPDGVLWFSSGTTRRGLYRRHPDGRIEEVRMATGSRAPHITDIEIDEEGRVWAAGEDVLLVHADGWLRRASERPLPIHTVATLEGGVLVGTAGLGTHRFDAHAASVQASLSLDAQVLDGGALALVWRVRTRRREGLAPDILTRFRIDGGTWSTWSRDRQVRVEGVAPGSHDVTVEALAGITPGSRASATAKFRVPTAFWARPEVLAPFGVLVAILLGVAGWSFLRIRNANAEKADLGERFQQFADNVRDAFWLVDWQTETTIYVNSAAAQLFDTSVDEILSDSRAWRERLHPDDRERIPREYRDSIDRYGHWDAEFRLQRGDGAVAWLAARAFAIHDESGAILRVAGIAEEVTDKRASEDLRKRLSLELDHRVKNALSQVVAIAEQSLHRSASTDDFAPAFMGRIRAMARSHEALSRNRWAGVPVHRIVETSLETLAGSDRYRAEGPVVTLTPRASGSFALAVHELATNAVKYGALKSDGTVDDRGTIDVRWFVDDGPVIRVEWRENCTRRVEIPRRQGLGLTLVRGLIEHELGGVVQVDFRPGGLECSLQMPGSLAATTQGSTREQRDAPQSTVSAT